MRNGVRDTEETTLDRLLEPDNPGVRAAARRHLLDRPAGDPERVAAEARTNRSEPVSTLLDLRCTFATEAAA